MTTITAIPTAPVTTTPTWFAREQLAGYPPHILTTRLLVAGAGALGSSLAALLAMWGFHRAILVDPDTYELTNAARTLDFPWRRVQAGQPVSKACELARHWRRRVQQRSLPVEITGLLGYSEELPQLIWQQAEVVLCAVDHPRARHDVAMLAKRYGKTLICGGFDGQSGQWTVTFVGADAAACPSCPLAEVPVFASSDTSCTSFGQRAAQAQSLPATPTLANAVATAMVEALTEYAIQRLAPTQAFVRKADTRPGWSSDDGPDGLTRYRLSDNPECPHHEIARLPSQFQPRGRTLGAILESLDRQHPGAELSLLAPLVVNTLDEQQELVRIAEPAWRVPSQVPAGRWQAAPAGEPVLVLERVGLVIAQAYGLLDLPAGQFRQSWLAV